jgi:recombination protein RecT
MTTQLAQRLDKQAPKAGNGLAEMLDRQTAGLQLALPHGLDAARFKRNVLTLVKATPGLVKCDPLSVVQGAMFGAQLGLEPGAQLGHFYLVPRGGQATFQLGYKGLLELVRRSGDIDRIEARAVYEADIFDLEFGTAAFLRHRPALTGDRGEIVVFYALAVFRGGQEQVAVMRRDEVDQIRDRASAKSGPWVSDYEQMGCKTVLRRLCKVLPLRAETAASIAADDQVITVPLSPSMVDDQSSEPRPEVDDVEDSTPVVEAEVVE